MTPEEQAADQTRQTKHAEKLRVERAISDMTGASRSQIRNAMRGLQEFGQNFSTAPAQPFVPPTAPRIEVEETTLAPLPIPTIDRKPLETFVQTSTPTSDPVSGDTTAIMKQESGVLYLYYVYYAARETVTF